jgi:hypothetical protein
VIEGFAVVGRIEVLGRIAVVGLAVVGSSAAKHSMHAYR